MCLHGRQHRPECGQFVGCDLALDGAHSLVALLHGSLDGALRRALRVTDVMRDEREGQAWILRPRRLLDDPPAVNAPAVLVEVRVECSKKLAATVDLLEL